jgi:hypothetical protein
MLTFRLPDGLTYSAFRKHPVCELLRQSAYFGAIPSERELDSLGLPRHQRDDLRTHCVEVARLHDSGERQAAWALGDERAADLIDWLDDDLRDPAHWRAPDPHADVSDPRELAALIPRF